MKSPETKFEYWLENINGKRKKYWDENYNYKAYEPLTYKKSKKFIKIISENSVWGFVSMIDGTHKGAPIIKGDLLKGANWSTPAKHSRGNIFEGTESWTFYGPTYLK